MKSYKEPSFQDRAGRAAEAKQKALDNFRSKPPVDESVLAERQAARLKREANEAERGAAKKAAEKAASDANEAAAQAAAVSAARAEDDKKRARDARYAARKSRR